MLTLSTYNFNLEIQYLEMLANTLVKRKNSYRHGNLYNACIEAGILLIKQKGIERLSLREVAKAIGVSHNAPYRSFKNREELFVAITIRIFEELQTELRMVLDDPSGDPKTDFKRLSMVFFNYAINNPEKYRIASWYIIDKTSGYPELLKRATNSYLMIFQFLKNYQNEGKLKINNPERMTLLCISTLHGYCSLIIEGRLSWLGTSDKDADEMVHFIASNLYQLMQPNEAS